MRLINVDTLRLEEYLEDKAPQYAILSHTWGAGEVSLQAMEAAEAQPQSPTRSLPGYQKIVRACRESKNLCLQYCWIDTCCIDKTSSAELSEAINSMFRWYSAAAVCIVVLEDYLHESSVDGLEIGRCRWFTRGWTLQELLANKAMRFYDARWVYLATKQEILKQLSRITGIDVEVLSWGWFIWQRPVACRLSWASNRDTSRVEDQAYCLLGIMRVNMPLIYGEGHDAFRRLQHEILQRHDDPSLFLWSTQPDFSAPFQGMLAEEVRQFEHCGSIRWFKSYSASYRNAPSFAVTTRGLRVTRPRLEIKRFSRLRGEDNVYLMPLSVLCNDSPEPRAEVGRTSSTRPLALTLCKIGPGIYLRKRISFDEADMDIKTVPDLATPEAEIHIVDKNRTFPCLAKIFIGCRAPLQPLSDTPWYVVQPRAAWDSANSCFISIWRQDFRAYIKIYPDANLNVVGTTKFDFFVVTFQRLAAEHSVRVNLVPQDIWTMHENLRQDEDWLLAQTDMHPASSNILLSNDVAHRVGSFNILPTFKFGRHNEPVLLMDLTLAS